MTHHISGLPTIGAKTVKVIELFGKGGVSLGNFEQISAWECFLKLANTRGETVIVFRPDGFSGVFAELFASMKNEPEALHVIMASPSILDSL